MVNSTVESRAVRATSVVVRMLPALAITVGLLGIVVATTTFAAVGSGVLVACAAMLELGGWGGATRAHAPALGTAALIGALVCGLGFVGLALLGADEGEPSAITRDGVARR